MHRRQGEAQTNARMVLEGRQGQPGADICPEPQRSHSPYDQWRDQFLTPAAQAFEAPQHPRTEARCAPEPARLQTRVGALTRERQHSDARWGSRGGGRCGSGRAMRRCVRVGQRSQPHTRLGAIAVSGPPCASSSRGPSTRSGFSGGCGHTRSGALPTRRFRPSGHPRGAHPAPPGPMRGGAVSGPRG